ncbi:MAG: DUF1673 family protein [Methanosarcinaceae archaeon]|nr:DUF1673 family protein [Methanosarcinaceae archaeon]
MIALIENIREMMGWCPNASTIKYKETMSFDTPQMNDPNVGSGSIYTINGLLNKYRNRVLLYSLIFTLLAIGFFMTAGMYDPGMFLSGIIVGLLSSLIAGAGEWHRLNKVAAGKFMSQKRTWMRKVVQFLVLVSLIALVTFSVGFLAVKSSTNIQGVYVFMSGFLLSVWTQYFEVLYWERKNGKTLILDKTSFYAVDVEN